MSGESIMDCFSQVFSAHHIFVDDEFMGNSVDDHCQLLWRCLEIRLETTRTATIVDRPAFGTMACSTQPTHPCRSLLVVATDFRLTISVLLTDEALQGTVRFNFNTTVWAWCP